MRLICYIVLFVAGSSASALARYDEPLYHYQGRMTVDVETGHIAVHWSIDVLRADQTEVTFVLNSNLGAVEVSGDVTGYELTSEGPLQNIRVALTAPREGRVIDLSYAGVLLPEPLSDDINAITPERIELTIDSFWLPADASFQGFFTSDLTVEIGEAWQGVGNGTVTTAETGLRIVNPRPSLDIAFTFAPTFRVTEGEQFNLFDLRPHDDGIENLQAAAAFCFDYLNRLYGAEDPLPHANFVIHARAESAYNRQNYVTLTDIGDDTPEFLTQLVCHELAHYWSIGGNFNTVENWLNESFADQAANMALRERFGREVFEARMERYRARLEGQSFPPIWIPGMTERQPYLINYRAGPLALRDLEIYLGEETFQAFMTAYMVGRLGTTPDVLAALEDVAGPDASDWFEQRLAQPIE